ncbi:MAG TPA: iron-sulfur cluster assembly protein [Polyangiaceae bacterium LLY-WYZ-15_(1-7)]|nr:iron-sulfur cluster assembly protein [Polyangiaceae bacterium LLY-WYZ-15_(1-7)]HJL03918.1 iron-sulfur cluster assembly protein [Polyangiaceae bacterium LLY-WYZ-15_(1-7)]HJL07654.1 iron-sulfur cluster assembly protein [Polyangiaceae bacterium LLY-WYZ-15_(1-7)]HJL30499.1 iron-sulfur cluster assembly protein [Polyangiaceae bacterium LLY-WYZ-15_(1-7)]HJL38329.1 iron-sulfur cluster assembly protein [Polyangiaceae bacterium LLY-WYZ-15_(1-7)]
MPRDFDVDDLKVHKIAPREEKKGRVHLPVAGPKGPPPDASAADVDEAFGGSGEAPAAPVDPAELEERVVATLKTIYDPEIPLNVYDLGLIYGLDVGPDGEVEVRMTLTAPACPVAGQIVQDVAQKVGATEGVARSHVKLVWDPPWTKERMTEDALLELGLL